MIYWFVDYAFGLCARILGEAMAHRVPFSSANACTQKKWKHFQASRRKDKIPLDAHLNDCIASCLDTFCFLWTSPLKKIN